MNALVSRWFWPALLLTLCAAVSILILTPPAHGQCATPYNRVVVKKEVVVVKEVAAIITPVVATFIAVPLYTAIYVPSYAPPAYAPPAPHAPVGVAASSETREILDLLKGMDTRLRKLEGGAPPSSNPPLGAAPPDSAAGLRAMSTKCASCHEAKVSADKGGGLTLFNGPALVALNDKQIRRILTVTGRGKMPPPKSGITLTDEEASAIIATFDKP